jgi:glucose-1-phosphate thymidylyltransferase
MIYYPLSVLLLAGIREILVISTPHDLPMFKQLFGDGSNMGIRLEYAEQSAPKGLAEAFIIGEEFIGNDDVCLILGDNVFYGQNLTGMMHQARNSLEGAGIFGYAVKNPKEFGIIETDDSNEVISIEEKPKKPKSNLAVPGLYFYKSDVVEIAKNIEPSPRGEIEITAINNAYLIQKRLKMIHMGRGIAWLDTGTPEGILRASEFVETIQQRQGMYVACIEEIAWRRGFITLEQLHKIGNELKTTDYGKYILGLKN